MPKSKGRRTKPQYAPKTRARTDRPSLYRPARLATDSEGLIASLLFSPDPAPQTMVEVLPAAVWLHHMQGRPANVCVEATLTLRFAYEQLGIEARVLPVQLRIEDPVTGWQTDYGRSDPFWDERVFHGHCVLWLPGSHRFIDATVEQYPPVRHYRLGPIVGRATTGGAVARPGAADPPAGWRLAVRRKDLLLTYTTITGPEVVVDSDWVRGHRDRYRRAGINLASEVLVLLRGPEVIERVPVSDYPRLGALLTAVGGAELSEDESGDRVFARPGADGRCRPVRLDEIAL